VQEEHVGLLTICQIRCLLENNRYHVRRYQSAAAAAASGNAASKAMVDKIGLTKAECCPKDVDQEIQVECEQIDTRLEDIPDCSRMKMADIDTNSPKARASASCLLTVHPTDCISDREEDTHH
jgi:hypothetical protein